MSLELRDYQIETKNYILNNTAGIIYLPCGGGKTISCLSAIDEMINNRFEDYKILIVGPKRPIETVWTDEIVKWQSHFKGELTTSLVLGTQPQRVKALEAEADIYLINRENFEWLVLRNKWDFDFVIIDEITSFKNATSTRFKRARLVRPKIKKFFGLTGTPKPNGSIDLWAQFFLVDQGEALGKNLFYFHKKYCYELEIDGRIDHKVYPKFEKDIVDKIKDLCLVIDKKDMPELVIDDIYVPMPSRILDIQKSFIRQKNKFEKFLKYGKIAIPCANRQVLRNKLEQLANGAIYYTDKDYAIFHNEKINAVLEKLETIGDENVLIFYKYGHDVTRLMEHLAKYNPRHLKSSKDINDWNAGKIRILLAHPKSAGHGLNLQFGGHRVFWFGIDSDLELLLQANDRLNRPGQKETVFIHRFIAKGMIEDNKIVDLLDQKAESQRRFMWALKRQAKKEKGENG